MDPQLIYDQTDIPPGMSCDEYRRRREAAAAAAVAPSRWTRLRDALHARRRRTRG
jgi:hypothetical protein